MAKRFCHQLKIQSKCQIYALHEENKKQNKNVIYTGYLFDKIKKIGDGKFQYMVYLQMNIIKDRL